MTQQPSSQSSPTMSRDEIIGFHKGSLNTLAAERSELLRLVQITEGLMHAHMQELEKLGIKLQTESPQQSQPSHSQPPRKR